MTLGIMMEPCARDYWMCLLHWSLTCDRMWVALQKEDLTSTVHIMGGIEACVLID